MLTVRKEKCLFVIVANAAFFLARLSVVGVKENRSILPIREVLT